MAQILRLVRPNNKETVALLQALSQLALNEEIDDLVVCYRRRGTPERFAASGAYRADTAQALQALVRAKAYLAECDNQVRGMP